MSRRLEITPADDLALQDAIDFQRGKTIAQLHAETGVDKRLVKRWVDARMERGTLERRGNSYRIDNAAPWRT